MIINNRVTTALLLAAGTGSRLRPLTLDAPKCLTEVGGEPILGRLIENLRSQGIKRLVVVTGYLDHCVRKFLEENAADFQLDYVFNPVYKTTNNIYSLWLARQMIDEPFILIESDLVFEPSLLDGMMTADKIAISNVLPWMNGTMVEVNQQKTVTAFHVKHNVNDARQYKTVNIYSFSLQSWNKVVVQLDNYIANELVNEYYETVFADMVADGCLQLDAVFFDENKWYEIDTLIDLNQAELMFPRIPQPVAAGRYSGVVSRPIKNTNAVAASNKLLATDSKTVAINISVPEKTICH
ncbi:MAG: phosphocholine cytidylyltransferase family protein [Gammaproteobacteria bacterium]